MSALRKTALAAIMSLIAATATLADMPGDPDQGQQVFKKCAACHMVGPKARNRVGPMLNNILSARAAGVAGYRYSKAIQAAGKGGLHWTPETLNGFLADPKGTIPGTKMSFRGLKSDADRTDVIAYLATFSEAEMATNVDAGFAVSADILAFEGDVEYGEYLSSECTTCHQSDGDNDGIPGIVGWEPAAFVTAMHAYKQKHRDNQVMQMITARLGDEEIAALAAYFNGLDN